MPITLDFPRPTNSIIPVSEESCGLGIGSTAPASAVWPAANRALFVPFRLYRQVIAYSMMVANGAAVSGNIDMGIYTQDGTRLASKGSTAHANINVKQQLTFGTPLVLGAGLYYMALACDNTTSAFFRRNPGVNLCKFMGMAQMAAAFVLPATVTFATVSAAYIPMFGVKFFNV